MKQKFQIFRTDGTPLPKTATFFVLRLDSHGDPQETEAARKAVTYYAQEVHDHKPQNSAAALYLLNTTEVTSNDPDQRPPGKPVSQ